MSKVPPNNDEKEFVVVFRASSAPIFEPSSNLTVNFSSEDNNTVLNFQTRQRNVGLDNPLPGDLWIDARGQASSLEEAVTLFGKTAAGVMAAISFSTNAAIGDLEMELAFDNTPSISKRIFLQSFLPNERSIIHIRRIVNVAMTCSLMEAINKHSEKERIIRAIGQYNLALRHWRWGHETLAIAHLFMGIEALAKAVARYRQGTSELSDEDFAKELGIDLEKLDSFKSLHAKILTVVRSKILFKGDNECHREAKKASDGFEHGFLPYGEIRDSAVKVRDKTASYLRESIIELLDLDHDVRSFYMDKSKNKPIGNWPVVKYIRGYLIGESDDLAAEGNEYPIFSWKSQIKSINQSETGEYMVSFDDKFTARLGNEIQFQQKSFEVWRP